MSDLLFVRYTIVMSGHNKWSKIKHKKAATDAGRSRIFARHARAIAMESKLANGDITHPGLLAAIERSKKDSFPKENIERAISRGREVSDVNLQSVLFEAYGPGGVAMIMTAITDNNNRTNQLVKHALTSQGYQLGSPGSALWAFTKNPSGYVPQNPIKLSTSDLDALESLIASLEDIDDIQDIYTTAVPHL